ncbi:DUF7344 domain-containing protein [Salinirarus marinus]|uniref:DUF7344 domain-containing protein n=1 Tax=Salinirarus marinus TaxID=3068310 RepID=UPI003C6C13D8
MFQVRRHTLPECQIHQILANPRRRAIFQHLGSSSSGAITIRALSESIATAESGQSPAPRKVRESVYTSLHQTHLPKLDALGVVEYDRTRSEVRVLDRARDVDRYMDVVTGAGVTWGEYYLGLGVFSLVVIVTALAGIPGVGLVDPLLWASGALATFALSAGYQLWTDRWGVLRTLRR